jgi:hypothetical protein
MQNPHTFHYATFNVFDQSPYVKQRDFTKTLFKFGGEQCIELLGDELKVSRNDFTFCRNEVMVASSCVLLSKANTQLGDYRDNVGLCKYEIKLAKENLKQKFEHFPNDKFDTLLRDLSRSTKSFC